MSDQASVIIGMRRNGYEPREIAAELDVPVSRVNRTLRSAGHPICERTGQRCYTSERKARKSMRLASNKVRVYRCPHGQHYHVTSQADGWDR
jgi:hypothetical protein